MATAVGRHDAGWARVDVKRNYLAMSTTSPRPQTP